MAPVAGTVAEAAGTVAEVATAAAMVAATVVDIREAWAAPLALATPVGTFPAQLLTRVEMQAEPTVEGRTLRRAVPAATLYRLSLRPATVAAAPRWKQALRTSPAMDGIFFPLRG
ncbi:MAG TPA: hypothetical protein VL099_01030 [Candidatus Binatia bacterium]|nr:hypothetical protein [Candidatus Binatia bacterium]